MFYDILLVTKPIIVLSVTALLALLLEVLLKKDFNKNAIFIVSIIGLLYALYNISHSILNFSKTVFIFGGSFRMDEFSLGISFILVFGTLLVVLISYYSLDDYSSVFGDFYSLILFSLVGMLALSLANDMFTFFISFEIMSVSVYILSGFYVRDFKSNEGSVKYLILGAFSTAFLVLGIAFVYGASGEIVFNKIADYFASGLGGQDSMFALLGLGFILVGFLFKIGAVPFHQWLPDAYEGAPTAITAFMSTSVKAAAFAIFVRSLFTFFKAFEQDYIINVLMVITIITLIGGNFLALVQSNIKRLLAFSSIAHSGYLLIYLIAGLKAEVADYNPILFYLLAYMVMNIGAFAVLMNVKEKTLEGIRGFGYRNRFLALAMSIFLFSLAGIPSTAGFMGKFFIFKYAIAKELYVLSIVGILSAVLSVYYYLRIIVYMYLKDESFDYPFIKARWTYLFVVLISLVLTLCLGIFPHIGFYFLLG